MIGTELKHGFGQLTPRSPTRSQPVYSQSDPHLAGRVATIEMDSLTLHAIVEDMEKASQQMHNGLIAVKRIAESLQRPNLDESALKTESECNGETTNSGNDSATGIIKTGSECKRTIEEPMVLRIRREINSRKPEEDTSIKASGFGQDAEDEIEELSMHPEWLELMTKVTRALQGGPPDLRSEESFIAVSVSSKRFRASMEMDETPFLRNVGWLPAPVAPHAPFRLVWDVGGAGFLVMDAFTLPIMLAWDLTLSTDSIGGVLLTFFVYTSLAYWTLDIVLNFNTGFYASGILDLGRLRIIKHYGAGWFLFDLLIVLLDVLFLSTSDTSTVFGIRGSRAFFRGPRFLRTMPRVLRALRLLRLMKMSRFRNIIEEIAVVTRRAWLLIFVSMARTLFGMIVAAHVLSCLWYFIGRLVQDSGRISWLENTGALDIAGPLQYMHALQWLLTPPAPAPIEPGNFEERCFLMFLVVFALMVMGSALGTFTNSLQELSYINAEKSRKRREVRSYLQSQKISLELTNRIMRFVDYKLSLQDASAALDLSLISQTLQMELYVNQRSSFLANHPLFSLTKELYPAAYANICSVVVQQVFEKSDVIFAAGEFATVMVITAMGDYVLIDGGFRNRGRKSTPLDVVKFSGVHWFADACIYAERMIHHWTLRADSFCDAFTLSGSDIRVALQHSPICTHMFCEYAKDFLAGLRRGSIHRNFEATEQLSHRVVQQNRHYMELYPDPNTLIEHFGKDISPNSLGQELDRPHNEATPKRKTHDTLPHFVQQVLDGIITKQHELSEALQNYFPELNFEHGSHATFSHKDERDRSESSCLSLLNLVADQYENFSSPQEPAACLTKRQWLELREIVRWIAPTHTQVHAVLVLLAIKLLGKSKQLVRQLPHEYQRPEAAVMYLVQSAKNVVPSVNKLDEYAQQLLIDALKIHEGFNFAQLLQGENSPANIQQLRDMIEDNLALLKVYMLFFLGFISGVNGGHGSCFMNSERADAIILGCRALKHLMSASPQAIFWSYMNERARLLSLPTQTAEDLVVVRLACLGRVQNHSSYLKLRSAWTSISFRSRELLCKNFLADGIIERAFVLEFFPLCISHALKNPVVRVPALLEVTADLLDNLAPCILQMHKIHQDAMMLPVDLSDLAEFISVVKNRFIFQTCIMRSKIRLFHDRLCLEMTNANWSRTHDSDSDVAILAHDVIYMRNKLDAIEERDSQYSHTYKDDLTRKDDLENSDFVKKTADLWV